MNDLPIAALPMQSDSFTVPFENVVLAAWDAVLFTF